MLFVKSMDQLADYMISFYSFSCLCGCGIVDVWKGGISAAAVHCKQVPVCPKKTSPAGIFGDVFCRAFIIWTLHFYSVTVNFTVPIPSNFPLYVPASSGFGRTNVPDETNMPGSSVA